MDNSAQRWTRHIKFGAGSDSKKPDTHLEIRLSAPEIVYWASSLTKEAPAKTNKVWHQRNLPKQIESAGQCWTRHIKFGAEVASKKHNQIYKS